jgi:hypothetical protein
MSTSNDQEVGKVLKNIKAEAIEQGRKSFGGRRFEMVTASAWTLADGEEAFAVVFVTAATPSVLTFANGEGTFASIDYPAAFTIYGQVTAITLAAGESVIIYKD